MTTHADNLAARFLELHHGTTPLLLANAWDAGSARILVTLGFEALATTSSGHAATLGREDGEVTREEALAHAATIVAAAPGIPVSADLEGCFADDPEGVADTVRLAVGTGLAGCSVEDATGDPENPVYEFALAVERVAAAADAAHNGGLVLTARCENYLYERNDLEDTITRLRAYQDAGADVVYAPGVRSAEDLRELVAAVEVPVNVLAMRGMPSVRELGEIGVARVSVGGAFAFAALGALVRAATELRDEGTYSYLELTRIGGEAAHRAFGAG